MSNKKKIITTKELAHSLGNKTPVQLVTSMASKKHGKYHLNGSKAEKKIEASKPHGKQSMKSLMSYGTQLTNIKITDNNIKSF